MKILFKIYRNVVIVTKNICSFSIKMANVDVESGNLDENQVKLRNKELFEERAIRHAFMRKVFTILTGQLVITCLIVTPLLLHEPSRETLKHDRGLLWASFIIFFAIYIIIICCTGVSRTFPQNYITLLILTIAASIWVGCICAVFDFQLILLALGICILLCLALTLFSLQTTIDFTALLGCMVVVVIAFIILAILFIFYPTNGLLWVLLIGGVTIFCIYFIIDIQLMMGGKHQYSLSPEDYILAAALLYLDVINIFLYILMILGHSRGS